jgi:hypothetical protein
MRAGIVAHCERLGLIDSSVVALDGTKVRANASGRKGLGQALREEIWRRLTRDVETDSFEVEEEVVVDQAPSDKASAATASGAVSGIDVLTVSGYNNSHKDFPKSGEALGQTRASAAHDSEIIYESRYKTGSPAAAWCHKDDISKYDQIFVLQGAPEGKISSLLPSPEFPHQ